MTHAFLAGYHSIKNSKFLHDHKVISQTGITATRLDKFRSGLDILDREPCTAHEFSVEHICIKSFKNLYRHHKIISQEANYFHSFIQTLCMMFQYTLKTERQEPHMAHDLAVENICINLFQNHQCTTILYLLHRLPS